MARVVRTFFPNNIDETETVAIPDVAPIPAEKEISDDGEQIDLAEQQRKANEEYLRKEYDRVYKEAYEAATAQANADITAMKDRLMQMAERERGTILETAQKEALYINESAKKGSEDIIKQAQEQYTAICKEAYQTGFTEGFKDKLGDLENFVKFVNASVEKLKAETENRLLKIESEIQWYATEIVDKILRAELSKDNSILVEMIKEAFKTVRDADYITVELSRDLKSLSKEIKDITKDTDAKVEVKVLPSDTAGSVVLQLDDRTIDISVFTQLGNIRELFARGFI